MIDLKCTDFIYLHLDTVDTIDIQIRQFEDEGRLVYLGQGPQLIQFFERDLDKVIKFLVSAKKLAIVETRKGFLK